jgi:hypothetical protein
LRPKATTVLSANLHPISQINQIRNNPGRTGRAGIVSV